VENIGKEVAVKDKKRNCEELNYVDKTRVWQWSRSCTRIVKNIGLPNI